MILTVDPVHDLEFLRSNIEIVVFQEWIGPDLFETFAEMNKKINIKAVNGNMRENNS